MCSDADPITGGYWVACQNNTLKWTYQADDPPIFSVALLNSNQQQLNGNYQIANSLNTTAGEATISLTCIPTGDYQVLFVNASQYSLNNPQVYKEGSTFTVSPNGTAPATATSVAQGSTTGSASVGSSTLSASLGQSSAASVISGQATSSAGHASSSEASSTSKSPANAVVAPVLAAVGAGLTGVWALL